MEEKLGEEEEKAKTGVKAVTIEEAEKEKNVWEGGEGDTG